jgi:hypothetical protein
MQKVFAPTIPTSRKIKNEAARTATEKPQRRAVKGCTSEKKGFNRRRKDVIKSESVFSMGPAMKSTQGQVGM